jgi:hypothetical protein
VIGIFITAWIYYRQLQSMGQQLLAQQKAMTAQTLLVRFQFLQDQNVREAREHVLQKLAATPYRDWDDTDRKHAATVCSSYTTVAIVLQLGLASIEPVLTHWGPSIRKCYGVVVAPYVKEMRAPENSGPTYWAALDWLHSQAQARLA